MVEPRPPFPGRRRSRMHNPEINPEEVSPVNQEQDQILRPIGRRRHFPTDAGEELREARPMAGHRHSRFHSPGQDEDCVTCPEVQDNPAASPLFSRRQRRLEDSAELPDTLGSPEDAMLRRRRAFNQAPIPGTTLSGNPTVPLVPPVPEPQQQRPVRGDSLLESIIKLINSILTFKGK